MRWLRVETLPALQFCNFDSEKVGRKSIEIVFDVLNQQNSIALRPHLMTG